MLLITRGVTIHYQAGLHREVEQINQAVEEVVLEALEIHHLTQDFRGVDQAVPAEAHQAPAEDQEETHQTAPEDPEDPVEAVAETAEAAAPEDQEADQNHHHPEADHATSKKQTS